jgi:hypothetical protein
VVAGESETGWRRGDSAKLGAGGGGRPRSLTTQKRLRRLVRFQSSTKGDVGVLLVDLHHRREVTAQSWAPVVEVDQEHAHVAFCAALKADQPAETLNLTPLAKQTVPSNPTQRGSRPQETAKMLRCASGGEEVTAQSWAPVVEVDQEHAHVAFCAALKADHPVSLSPATTRLSRAANQPCSHGCAPALATSAPTKCAL